MSEPASDASDLLEHPAETSVPADAGDDHDAPGHLLREPNRPLDTDVDRADRGETESDGDDQVIPPGGAALCVRTSAIHGTGVFATAAFEIDDVIERCPVLVVPPDQAFEVADTVFGDYVYEWEGGSALALGFGSLYNHSRASTARYEMDYDLEEIHVVAVQPIAEGDEITINYNGDHTDPSPVWFEGNEDEDDDEDD